MPFALPEQIGNLSPRVKTALAFAALFVLIVLFFGIQKACQTRTERLEDEKTKQYEADVATRLKVFQNYIEMANEDHKTTTAILDTMQKMTTNINLLAVNDREITGRVNQISENEYRQARAQKTGEPTIYRRLKPLQPIKQRENDALERQKEINKNQ